MPVSACRPAGLVLSTPLTVCLLVLGSGCDELSEARLLPKTSSVSEQLRTRRIDLETVANEEEFLRFAHDEAIRKHLADPVDLAA